MPTRSYRDIPATITEYFTHPSGRVRSVIVSCPFCRGRHQHLWNRDAGYAYPWCGTPGVAYRLTWPGRVPE